MKPTEKNESTVPTTVSGQLAIMNDGEIKSIALKAIEGGKVGSKSANSIPDAINEIIKAMGISDPNRIYLQGALAVANGSYVAKNGNAQGFVQGAKWMEQVRYAHVEEKK